LVDTRSTVMNPCHSAVSNLLYAVGGSAVCLTMVDGRVVYRNGEFPGLDMEKVRFEACRAVREILAR
jgi:5-methylthioadenosine/S-adenosylhomocysteine deaminase